MKTGWDYAKEQAEAAANGGIFVRLKNDGDSVVGVFVGEPNTRKTHWTGKTTVDCWESEDCPHCEEGLRASTRMALNFYVLKDSAMRVFEGSADWFVKDLLVAREKYTLDGRVFELKRKGAKGDTKTKYAVLYEGPVDPETAAKIARTKLHDLATVTSESEDDERPAEPPSRSSARHAAPARPTTVSEAVAREIYEQLKVLPRTATDAFLKDFRITRLRDLAVADENDARDYVGQLLQKQAPLEDAPGF